MRIVLRIISSSLTLLSLISVFLGIRSKELHPFLSVFSWAPLFFFFLFTVYGILVMCSKLAKLLFKTFASQIWNMTAIWFSLLFSSNYLFQILLTWHTGFNNCFYMSICINICFLHVLSRQVLCHLVFKIMRNRQVAVKLHMFLFLQ